MKRIFSILFSLPYSIWFNFRYLPFVIAYKLPIWIACNTKIKGMYRGGIRLENNIRFNSVHIGYHCADAVDTYSTRTILCVEKGGHICIFGKIHIGHGAIIHVKSKGNLLLGDNFAISGTTSIICSEKIVIGENVQFSWNSLVMDSDAHHIFNENNEIMNSAKAITIGNMVWIAANCTILKGAFIPDNVVIACNSLVNKSFPYGNCILAGIPAKAIKDIAKWEL